VLRAVTDGEDVNFLCLACFRCWHVELGWVQRVDPHSCAGCRAHDNCARTYAIDHPEPAHA
jgi:hypothetical protein